MAQPLEYCFKCNDPTGRAGWGDDSLYLGDEGPYCRPCFDKASPTDSAPRPFFHTTPKAETCVNGKSHDFQGWHDFEDGSGGETVCKHCGLGAMEHTLGTGL